MSSKLRFKHSQKGYFTLMKSEEMKSVLQTYADRVRQAANSSGFAGDNYSTSLVTGGTRAKARVSPADEHAAASNRRHNTLLKALGGAKDV